jgi:hypothetical protein
MHEGRHGHVAESDDAPKDPDLILTNNLLLDWMVLT